MLLQMVTQINNDTTSQTSVGDYTPNVLLAHSTQSVTVTVLFREWSVHFALNINKQTVINQSSNRKLVRQRQRKVSTVYSRGKDICSTYKDLKDFHNNIIQDSKDTC